jgi:beta-aspartyl-peptidase (threonine type)
MMRPRVVLAVHGGAGRLAKRKTQYPERRPYEVGLAEALRAGQQLLTKGKSALRAVTAAVRVMEDNELFNAARGAALCADGSVELSASVMNGRDRAVGAMVGLKRTKNPVLAANALLRHSHGLLSGAHADAFAERAGLEMVSTDYFLTPYRVEQWREFRCRNKVALDHSEFEVPHGTVGAIARDRRGNLAAATSTGGLVNQLPGRVGDSPVIGAGTWADNNVCAISATGNGDAFARLVFARRVADLIELSDLTPEQAVVNVLHEVARLRAEGGCIVLDTLGRLVCPFNSPQMIRGWVIDNRPPIVAILPGEEIEVQDV